MAFNINEISAQLTLGGARSNLFQVTITNPVNGAGDLKTPFMVRASSIPASTLTPIEVPYFGRTIKVAGDRTFAEWSVTIYNDEDFLIRNAMEQWMNSINAHEQNIRQFGSASPLQYKSQAEITQFSKTGVPVRTYQFNGLFPTEVAPITMSWDAAGAIEEFDVTFQYDWWEVSGGITGDAGGV